ncbi:unnamed protein product [Porites lobata]|uniref:DNA-directed DNA polymerase n=1 Tax=Porites lobata TaxID=104759 RepID=A0ABN8P4E6_9CNID|nr:unnamed protein product [Porites lobata]
MCLKTPHLRFLDVTNFLAPGFSYDKFLKAYECPQTKGFFPYEWLDSLDKLDHPSLPPHDAFFSTLKNENISKEDYQYCQQVWSDHNMQTFKDFLIWYNNLDVQPFCEALEKMCAFWKDKKIDMLRQGISIPGVTLTYLFTTLESGIFFSLFDEKNKDLYYLFKKNMVGGPSIIFHRYHEAGKTKIREREITDQGKEPKMCQKIVGYDANALYLWAIMQNMPTGSFTRRREETNFKKESSTKMATEWLEWKAHEGGIFIRHQMNNTEKRIGERRLPVDGFHGPSHTVFQFHGLPDHLKPKFSEMCPIFKNTQISREDIGEYMQTFAEEQRIMPQPRRSLIGSYFGEKILLATPLIKWYLEHGLEVTRIYQVVEYTPVPCFQPFGEAVSDARRAGDVDPNKAIIADTMKLVGNSSYGKTITDQERHREVKFCEETKASRLINTPFFRQIDQIEENTYEVQSCKKTVKLNLPMQIGFFVYQYAKLRMLQFYFDFMDKYLDRSDFQYCEMDTDSAYIAIAGQSVESLVKPGLREEFEADKANWFPRTDTPEHKAYDKRTPGLFKEEWSGAGIIGLSSKTYYCFGDYDKFSCKGVNKKTNDINKEKYLNVLLTKQSSSGLNKGFRVVNNSMYTYEQVRDGFSYFYPKRKVLEDGVTTVPLDI